MTKLSEHVHGVGWMHTESLDIYSSVMMMSLARSAMRIPVQRKVSIVMVMSLAPSAMRIPVQKKVSIVMVMSLAPSAMRIPVQRKVSIVSCVCVIKGERSGFTRAQAQRLSKTCYIFMPLASCRASSLHGLYSKQAPLAW